LGKDIYFLEDTMKNKMVFMLLVLCAALGFANIAPQKSKETEGIMAYCTVADLQDAYGEDRINGWARFDVDIAERAVKNAEAEIDGYLLSGGYEIPISGPPETIRKYCIDIASANLVVSGGILESDPGGKAVVEQAKIARQYLGKVAEGKYKIPSYIEDGAEQTVKPLLGWYGYQPYRDSTGGDTKHGGAGIEAYLDRYQDIRAALSRMAKPDIKKIADFTAAELHDISNTAFEQEADPVTGTKWEPLKSPRPNGSILRHHSILYQSLTHVGSTDGTAVLGTNIRYARIHQEGSKTAAHEIRPVHAKALHVNGRFIRKVKHPGSTIPARPYMGIPRDFERLLLNDPYILKLLGVET
jgi:phage gpG-like protein/phage gp36-like protein